MIAPTTASTWPPIPRRCRSWYGATLRNRFRQAPRVLASPSSSRWPKRWRSSMVCSVHRTRHLPPALWAASVKRWAFERNSRTAEKIRYFVPSFTQLVVVDQARRGGGPETLRHLLVRTVLQVFPEAGGIIEFEDG